MCFHVGGGGEEAGGGGRSVLANNLVCHKVYSYLICKPRTSIVHTDVQSTKLRSFSPFPPLLCRLESAEEEQSIEDDTEADKDFVVDDVKKRKHGKDAGSTGKRRRGGSSKASADNAITSPKVRRQNKKSSTKVS